MIRCGFEVGAIGIGHGTRSKVNVLGGWVVGVSCTDLVVRGLKVGSQLGIQLSNNNRGEIDASVYSTGKEDS
jgi:hypothetical protein